MHVTISIAEGAVLKIGKCAGDVLSEVLSGSLKLGISIDNTHPIVYPSSIRGVASGCKSFARISVFYNYTFVLR